MQLNFSRFCVDNCQAHRRIFWGLVCHILGSFERGITGRQSASVPPPVLKLDVATDYTDRVKGVVSGPQECCCMPFQFLKVSYRQHLTFTVKCLRPLLEFHGVIGSFSMISSRSRAVAALLHA